MRIVGGADRILPVSQAVKQAQDRRRASLFSAPIRATEAIERGYSHFGPLANQHGFIRNNDNGVIYSNGHGMFQRVNPAAIHDHARFITKDGGRLSAGRFDGNAGLIDQLLQLHTRGLFTPRLHGETGPQKRDRDELGPVRGDRSNLVSPLVSSPIFLGSNIADKQLREYGQKHPSVSKWSQVAADFVPFAGTGEYFNGSRLISRDHIDRSDPKEMLFAALSALPALGALRGAAGAGRTAAAADTLALPAAPARLAHPRGAYQVSESDVVPRMMHNQYGYATPHPTFMADAGRGGSSLFGGDPYFDTLIGQGTLNRTNPWLL